jgi:hypothetical protein
MRTKTKRLVTIFTLLIASMAYANNVTAQQNYVSFEVFYDQLSPYGQWVDYPNYGYVWIPDAGSDFVPYSTRGRWIMTDYGWTWFSDYNWGWAPFHYGRWDFDNFYGWFWVPDGEWGPAWVNWRSAEGYYGWAPMEPGISLSVSFGREYNRQNDHWIFVRDRYIGNSNMNRYYVNRNDHERIIRNSTVINNTYIDNSRNTTYVTGPARDDVQRRTGRRVSSVSLQESSQPGQNMKNGNLRIYRPQISRNNDAGNRPAPSRIVDLKEVKRPAERNEMNQRRNSNPTINRNERRTGSVNSRDNRNNPVPEQKQNETKSGTNSQERQPVRTNTQDNRGSTPAPQQNADQSRGSRREKQAIPEDQTNRSRREQSEKSRSERKKKRSD